MEVVKIKNGQEVDRVKLRSSTIKQETEQDKLKKLSLPRTFNQRLKDASNLPDIVSLLGHIWMKLELHILFADTGVGKSIKAVAIANAISKGENYLFLENQSKGLKVLLYDFELSDKQAEKRYSEAILGFPHIANDNFYYDTIDFIELDETFPNKSFEELIFMKIENDIRELGIEVLIIDNMTYLKTESSQKTEAALVLMRELMKLKKKYGLSILVLAHTPKRLMSSPITINDLAGSKHLSNFADSVSAIGKSSLDKDTRYWKQVKPSRSAEMMYDGSNVITCMIDNPSGGFLTFSFLSFDSESKHLKDYNEERDDQKELARELHEEGKSYAQIAEEILGSSKKKSTIHNWLNKN